MLQKMLSLPLYRWLEVVCRADFFGGLEIESKMVQRLSENGVLGKRRFRIWIAWSPNGVP
jgi:hypothetical protein